MSREEFERELRKIVAMVLTDHEPNDNDPYWLCALAEANEVMETYSPGNGRRKRKLKRLIWDAWCQMD